MHARQLRLVEFAPSKTLFNSLLNDTSIQMGFECELITNVYSEDGGGGYNEAPDYDNMSWDQCANEVSMSRRTRDSIQEEYFEWLSKRAHEWLDDKWKDDWKEFTLNWCIDNGHIERDEEDRVALEQDVDDIMDTYRSDARDDFNEEFREEADDDSNADMDDFISDEYSSSNIRLMNEYSVEYEMNSEDEEGTDEADVHRDIARALRRVVGRSARTDAYDKDPNEWYVEPDGSLRGDGYVTAEVVSSVYPLGEGLNMLQKIFNWMSDSDYSTNDSTGLHVSFSIVGMESPEDFDFLKMMVLYDENYTANIFDRLSAYYAKQMRDVLFSNFANAKDPVSAMSSRQIADTIVNLHNITKNMNWENNTGPGMAKYFSFRHRANGVVEFRSMGGVNYEKKFDIIRKRIVNMAYLMKVGSDPGVMARDYIMRIYKMLTGTKFKDPELGSGAGSVIAPPTLNTLQSVFDRDPELLADVDKHPILFLNKIAQGIYAKTINLGPQQTRQIRYFAAKMKIGADAARSAFQRDATYNALANLMRWPLVVPGEQDTRQDTLPFARAGRPGEGDMSGTPVVPDPEDDGMTAWQRRDVRNRQGGLGGGTDTRSYQRR